MLQSLATFGAGVFTGQSLQTCRTSLPQCSITEDLRLHNLQSLRSCHSLHSSFKDQARLLLRCHGVNVPALPAPGVLSRQRPQLCVRLGAAEKQTETWRPSARKVIKSKSQRTCLG